MKHLFAFIASMAVALSPTILFAQAAPLGGGSNATPSVSSSNGGIGGRSYIATTDTAVLTPKTDAMLNNAKEAAKQQDKGQKMAYITAGIMAGVAAATCPACSKRGTCSICGASLVGAAAAALTGAQMGQAKATSVQNAVDVNPVDLAEMKKDVQEDAGKLVLAKKDVQNAAKGTGFKVSDDLKTVTTPDGRSLSVNDAFSGGGGMSSGEQAALASELKKAQDEAAKQAGIDKMATEVVEEYGGGGGGSIAGKTSSDDPTGGAKAASATRSPSAVAGAFKEYNGEKIGVAMDSVFDMLHRRYKHHAEDRKSLNMQ